MTYSRKIKRSEGDMASVLESSFQGSLSPLMREFVGDIPWAHLDIAGTAYRTEPLPYLRKGATGIPTRLFVEWVRARAER